MMKDQYGDHVRVYAGKEKKFVFIDNSYNESPDKLQFRTVLDKKQALELIDKLKKAVNELGGKQ